MNDKIKNIIGYSSILLMVSIAIGTFIYRFANPELTETQILIKTWWIIIPLFICVYLFHVSFNSKKF